MEESYLSSSWMHDSSQGYIQSSTGKEIFQSSSQNFNYPKRDQEFNSLL